MPMTVKSLSAVLPGRHAMVTSATYREATGTTGTATHVRPGPGAPYERTFT